MDRVWRGLPAVLLAFALMSGFAGPARALNFSLARVEAPSCAPSCPDIIVASGEIFHGDAERLVDLVGGVVESRAVAPVVLIHSPGGDLFGGLKLGYLMRQLGMTVVVGRPVSGTLLASGTCSSACVYAFMGGKRRIVPPGSRLFVHWSKEQPRMRDPVGGGYLGKSANNDEVDGVLRRYARTMGVKPELIGLIRTVPFESGRELTAADLARFRVTMTR